MRRRYREPVFIAFAIALIASLSVHLPIYEVLGDLADRIKAEAESARKNRTFEPVEVDFDVADASKSQRARKEPRQREREARPRPQEPAAKPTVAQQAKPKQDKPFQSPPDSPQAVQQHSANPDVEPDSARFIAEQNNRVEEESVARVRNMVRDDQTPSPGRQQQRSDTLEEAGNASEEKIAEMRNKDGSDARKATPEEASRRRPDKAIEADPVKAERVANESPAGKTAQTSGDRAAQEAAETITITDPAGTFSIRRPSNGSQGGGARAKGRGPGSEIAWSQFEAAVGSDELEQDRRAYLAEQKSSQRGISREKTWKEFRAAIENYVPGVKPGATTALNAAASPFATYIAQVHRRIHQEFADRFLRSLPIGSPYQDPTLMTKLEIVLNRDGSVHRVGVVRSSGLLPFDFGAFNSVLRGQPYPPAPSSILSGDGRVYFHWGFYRNQRQCGTFNAEPYIVPNPRGTRGRQDGLTDAPEWDTIVPKDAKPTWRTRDEESEEEDTPQRPPEKSPPAQPRGEKEEAPETPPPPPGAGLG